MLRFRILSVYLPEKYLCIYTEKHLDFFLSKFYEDTDIKHKFPKMYNKQMELIRIKNEDPIARNLNGVEFSKYLYELFPINNIKEENSDINTINDDEKPKNNKVNKSQNVLLEQGEVKTIATINKTREENTYVKNSEENSNLHKDGYKIDYVEKQKLLIEIGSDGEDFVVEYEKIRLANSPKLVSKVKRVSLNDDSLGYDIKSYDEDGTKRYIEVESTNSNKSKK